MSDVYTSTKNFALRDKKYPPGKMIASYDIGDENIKRLLEFGYIKIADGKVLAKSVPGSSPNLPFYMTAVDYLLPEQIDKLSKPQLTEYAGKIGVAGFKASISAADLKALIKQFIEEAEGDEDEDDEA